MPTYATRQDLIDRAGEAEIVDIAARYSEGEPDADVIQAALVTTDHKIDAYLAVRYILPLSATPAVVVGWAVSIARYQLHRDGAPDYVVRDYKDAIAELKDAAAGRLAIPDLDGVKPQQTQDGATIGDGPEPQFTRDRLEGFL